MTQFWIKIKFLFVLMVLTTPIQAQYFYVLPLPYPIDYLEKVPLVEKLEIEEEQEIEEEATTEFAPLEHPNFTLQKVALGYEPGITFQVPQGLQPAVEFWELVYHHYSVDQYVIHDLNEHVIYRIVDISDLNSRKINWRSKQRLIARRLGFHKREVRELLNAVHKKRLTPAAMTQDEKKIYDLFSSVEEENKFLRAKYRLRSQLGQKERFQQGILWAGRYLPMMEKIFQEEGLPMELTRLPFVESSFNLKAMSRVGASGIWQFMRSTGQRFLRINTAVDERNDPIEATRAAAKLLKVNYNALQSWPLAVTGYNHGGAGMMRAVKSVGSKDIIEIIQKYRSPTFGFASKNFYAEFLAALDVEVEYEKYFGALTPEAPLKFEEVEVPAYISISALTNYAKLPKKLIKRFNPGLTYYVYAGKKRIPKGYRLKLPIGTQQTFLAAFDQMPSKYQHDSQRRFVYHKVRSGDTLSYIARRYGATVASIRDANRLGKFIYAGQTLVIPR